MFIATLIASGTLTAGDISEASDRLLRVGLKVDRSYWIDEGLACDIGFDGDPRIARQALERVFPATDVVVQPAQGRRKRLLVADMDSTMITVECIDELADYAGLKPQIAEVTERAMRGELDFADALDARVALLKGLDAAAIDRCLAERVAITPGAELLVRTMRGWGATTILVSGGFTRFAEPVADRIGFERVLANRLLIENDALTGKVEKPIVDSATKQATLEAAIGDLDIEDHWSMAIGDGANDLAMIRRAGLGVAYHAKPIVAAAAAARIDHGDLSALLYAQGVKRSEWVAE